ncbi:MAG: hypothetical protein KC502_16355 [Myxococcales bacterium]|nr:hypothetical protein [Myxococcales bacterium]
MSAAQIWMVGRSSLVTTLTAALERSGITVYNGEEPDANLPVVVVDCTQQGAHVQCKLAFDAAPGAAKLALVRSSAHGVIAQVFAAGADDFVVLSHDAAQAVETARLHVQLTLSRLGQLPTAAGTRLHPLNEPIIARSATPDRSKENGTSWSCVVTSRGRILSSSPSMATFIAAARSGATFFELLHNDDRPAVRNAAVLLQAGEAAVDIAARLVSDTGERALDWHLVLHPSGRQFLAIGCLSEGA